MRIITKHWYIYPLIFIVVALIGWMITMCAIDKIWIWYSFAAIEVILLILQILSILFLVKKRPSTAIASLSTFVLSIIILIFIYLLSTRTHGILLSCEAQSISGKYIYNDFRICKLVGEDKGSVVGVKIIVDLTVHSYNYDKDENYIIAYQIPSDSIGKPLPECYWLIDVQNDSIYGPLTLKSFMAMKRKLGVHLTFDKNIGSTTWCNELCHRVIEQDTCK